MNQDMTLNAVFLTTELHLSYTYMMTATRYNYGIRDKHWKIMHI